MPITCRCWCCINYELVRHNSLFFICYWCRTWSRPWPWIWFMNKRWTWRDTVRVWGWFRTTASTSSIRKALFRIRIGSNHRWSAIANRTTAANNMRDQWIRRSRIWLRHTGTGTAWRHLALKKNLTSSTVFMLMTILGCWWRKFDIGDIFWM